MSAPWHLGTMCSFDTETTGTDVNNDRIVTASIVYVDGTGQTPPRVREWLIAPGIDIPDAAARIHGVTTEHARANGMQPRQALEEITAELFRAIAEAIPLIAFNLAFDATIIDQETRRHGLQAFGPALGAAPGHIIDPYVLDKALSRRSGKRTLAHAAGYYGVQAGEAHTASGDAFTAARVAWTIAQRNPAIARQSPGKLREFQARASERQARSLRAYFERTGRDEPVDGSWPLRAQPGPAPPAAPSREAGTSSSRRATGAARARPAAWDPRTPDSASPHWT